VNKFVKNKYETNSYTNKKLEEFLEINDVCQLESVVFDKLCINNKNTGNKLSF